MQVSSTLIAAQQAARDAQARFQAAQVQNAPQAAPTSFTAALGKTDGFAPLPLKQTAPSHTPSSATPVTQAAPGLRPGSLLDIRI